MSRHSRPPLTRRRALERLGSGALAVLSLSTVPTVATARGGFDDGYRPGHTGGCDRYLDRDDEVNDERERFCAGPAGAYYELEEEGDERRYDYDAAGTLRRYVEEEADGDEIERWYDRNGVLRYERREESDGDEYEARYDAAGTRRYVHREDGDDGEDTYWWYDAGGNLVGFRDDD
jgi:hypothetical protein